MQRTITWVAALLLILVTALDIWLGLQNIELRQQIARAPAQTGGAQTGQEQASIAQLKQQLDRSEKDRIKATRDATSLRDQLNQLQAAAQERDVLKSQLQALQQENEQLRSQVSNLQTMSMIDGQVEKLRGLAPLGKVPREFMT